MEKVLNNNSLEVEKISTLLRQYAIPSIVAMLVGALYNVVDQIFIGQGVGILGNAATNVAFPITTITLGVALLLGIGTASNFNLAMGRGDKESASKFLGNALILMSIFGLIIFAITIIFLEKLLILFGATQNVLPYAKTYLGITSLGLPFMIFITSGGHLIRADGSPKTSMYIILIGALVNTILDPIFIFIFNWGIAGAAWATVISQVISFLFVINYLKNYKTLKLTRDSFLLEKYYFINIFKLGGASFFNQISMTILQIVLNNVIKYYGVLSVYGAEIPLASVGIVMKINTLLFAFSIGIAQGGQPIIGYNYGAKNYDRVKSAIKLSIIYSVLISTIGFLAYQFLPRQIIGIFGDGSEEYFSFATKTLRIFLFMSFGTGILPIIATFFTSIGKANKGFFMTLTRQFLFQIPLILYLPTIFGLEGVMYSGPVSDIAAILLSIFFLINEIKIIDNMKVNLTKSMVKI